MVGITRTKEIVMRSRRIPGPQAFQWGVATDCVPDALEDELRSSEDFKEGVEAFHSKRRARFVGR